ncbi:FAD-dependent thymidylate synthase [Brevibacillus dissolubilis]|uniref:FAD-dependent thymidylate synthase n=1 Tax=Brevibacillus dissolubilis TaxID=1844116 RepID=UPI00111713DE|nr:FAD-dependent thymidylate synthase [Brevibacillus dissolubilis]
MKKNSRSIYAIYGSSPEVTAYGMAKYSRSSLALRDSIKELSQQKAEEFLNTFYFQYGHSSIADLAHVAVAIEQISIWAAMILVDEPLWDGQERSTRYQDFMKTQYYVPTGAPARYSEIADQMFTTYQELTQLVQNELVKLYPAPAGMAEDAYQRTMRARAFDVSRYWLPLATNTSLGQITSARTLERQISRLFSHGLPELADIAQELKDAVVKNEPVNFGADEMGPLLPTLAKYTGENLYITETRKNLKLVADQLLAGIEPDVRFGVELFVNQDPVLTACTTLLYSVSTLSYRQIYEVVEKLQPAERQELIDIAFSGRGRHDSWLRELQMQPLVFDITMDVGSFRDLNRHRKVAKTLQEPSLGMGYAVPEILGEIGLHDRYVSEMDAHYAEVRELMAEWSPVEGMYLLPMGALCRSLHQMDLQQAAYMAELRTGSTGHFSYREIAYQMYERVAEAYPEFASYIRVTNPREEFDPFKR